MKPGMLSSMRNNYLPVKIRTAIVPITNIGSRLSMPLILLGLLFGATSYFFATLAYVGVACFALSTIFQLVTLPTEFDASRRALTAIEQGACSAVKNCREPRRSFLLRR